MANLVGAGAEEIVFVPNTSHGLNTVLRNIVWNKEDIILIGRRQPPHLPVYTSILTWPIATTTYNSMERTSRYIGDLPPHPSVSLFELKFPTTRASLLRDFHAHVDVLSTKLQIAQRLIGNETKLKIVALIDSIASSPGVYLPWKEMVALCRERSILTVIDAAHSIGQEPDINLSEADPDFWASVRPMLYRMSHKRAELNILRVVTSGFMPNAHAASFTCLNGMLRTQKKNHSLLYDTI